MILNHEKINVVDEDFIEQVKNDENIFKTKKNKRCQVLKKCIMFYINQKKDFLSDQTIIARFTYENLNKIGLSSDLKIATMGKVYDNMKSFYALREKGMKCQRPKYLDKDSKFNLIFFKKCWKEINKGKHKKIRLTVGFGVNDKYEKITKRQNLVKLNEKTKLARFIEESKLKNINKKNKPSHKDNYILNNKYVNKNNPNIISGCHLDICYPSNLSNKNILCVEIIPLYDGYNYKINYVYEDKIYDYHNISTLKPKNTVSVDLGVVNLMTLYDPTGKQIIISGKHLVSTNYRYGKYLDYLKSSKNGKNNNKIDNEIHRLLIKKKNVINHYFNLVVDFLVKKYKHKDGIVLGYNRNWKTCVNLGKKNNRMFYEIPYKKLLSKIFDKLPEHGVQVIETEESYTSKCDALAFEEICSHEKYLGKRVGRGLFSSSKHKLINADLNG